MKIIILLLSVMLLSACNTNTDQIHQLTQKADSLQRELNNAYKPGLGEFMSSIQTHHAKLWFAGTNQNWPLADFEIHEIVESLEDIRKFNTDRPEISSIAMIEPVLDSLNAAIKQKKTDLFKTRFVLLTNTCNNCHKATDHAFNVVTIPSSPPVTNQEFKPAQ